MAGRPLKILQLKERSAEVEILKDNLAIIEKNLQKSGASHVSIISVMGQFRTGKSFLLDLMMRFLRRKAALAQRAAKLKEEKAKAAGAVRAAERGENQEALAKARQRLEEVQRQEEVASAPDPARAGWRFEAGQASLPEWMAEGNQETIAEGRTDDTSGFVWRSGKDRCTLGMWLWSEPFVFPDDKGRKVAVVLMDTQGAGDSTMAKAQSTTIFGLTALLSSKLIFNIPNRIDEACLENMDYITTFAQTVCATIEGGRGSMYGHLQLLVRDWFNYETRFTVEQCKEQCSDHLLDHMSKDRVPEDAHKRIDGLNSSFRGISCFALPHPGRKVPAPSYDGRIGDIEPDFFHLLDAFFEDFFGPDFPRASAPLDVEITTNSFQLIIMNFAEAFRENAEQMATGLREAFVKVEMASCKEELIKKFRQDLEQFAPESTVKDPVELQTYVRDLQGRYENQFSTKLQPWRLKDSETLQSTGDFKTAIQEVGAKRLDKNTQLVEGATTKIIAAPVVGTGFYFLAVHTWILTTVAAVGGWMHAKKWSNLNHCEVYDPSVLQGITDDIKKFCNARWMDGQAIWVALNRFNPTLAMDAISKAAPQAGAMAARMAAQVGGQSQAAGNSASNHNNVANGVA